RSRRWPLARSCNPDDSVRELTTRPHARTSPDGSRRRLLVFKRPTRAGKGGALGLLVFSGRPCPREPPGGAGGALAARRHVEIGWGLVGDLPAQELLVVQLVVRVRLFDHAVKCSLELVPVGRFDRLLHLLDVLGDELGHVLLVLGPYERTHLHEVDGLLQLEACQRLILRLAGVVALPDARADLRHDARQALLDVTELVEAELTLPGVDDVVVLGYVTTGHWHRLPPPAS